MQIDNARVEITGQELPGLDGSSLAFVEALSASGLILQSKPRRRLIIEQSYRLGDGRGWIQVDPVEGPSDHSPAQYEYQLSYDDSTPIAPQAFSLNCRPSAFIRGVASARTFVTAEQAAAIRRSGLATHVTDDDLVVLDETGQPRRGPWRFPNECARHKTLDMVGDLSMCGFDIVGKFTSFRGGHAINGRMAKRITALAAERNIAYKQPTGQLRLSKRAA